jgi:hypothetical protein
MSRIIISLLAILFIVLFMMNNILVYSVNEQEEYMDKALDLLKRLQVLSRKGMNVTGLVNELNKTMGLIQDGKIDSARIKLKEIEAKVSILEEKADTYYVWNTIYKYTEIASILSIPPLFYLLFPRIYLYLWFKLRKRWIVRGSSR